MKALPPLPPELQEKADQFYAGMCEALDRYIAGVEMDMNRHTVKHGPMPPERMVYDFTQILVGQVNSGELPVKVLCGLVATAVERGVAKKRQGRG